jgi:hypothetical protein
VPRLIAAALCMALPLAAAGQERVRHALGDFEYSRALNDILITAPHGTFDARTARIAIHAARELGAGYLVAWRFVTPDKVRINVNRPTEGALLPCSQEPQTERAREVYDIYTGLVAKATPDGMRLYVEIHGNSNPKTAQTLEVATVGITAAQAQAIKDGYAALLTQARSRVRAFPELTLLIEPIDRIYWGAACAKRFGVFGRQPGLHFEFPRDARDGHTVYGSAMLVAGIVRRLLETP